ncbi:MAG: DNA-directed RNA polymerase subunit omega [Pyrinomonadaceae bacterium]|nr:DNA-directed RNA polymerase subunit omega [Pyrinomonadaceae bacterium]
MNEENLEQSELNEELNSAELVETEETGIPEIDSKYRLILLAAQRSKQLQKGANPRVNADVRKTKSTRIALEEFKQKKIQFEITEL